jgi:hypothetical protein
MPQASWRWWDGRTWTGFTWPPTTPQTARLGPSAVVQPAQSWPVQAPHPGVASRAPSRMWTGQETSNSVAVERSFKPWAIRAVLAYFLAQAAYQLVFLVYSNELRRFFHSLRVTFDDASRGIQAPQAAAPLPSWIDVASAIGIAAQVLLLVWQYRSARAAGALGYPASHSPGWGVVWWFIPVVNLWMPYQAIRDLLPPGNAHRRTVLQWWWLLLVSVAWNGATGVAVIWATPLHVALLAGCLLFFAAAAWRTYVLIQFISEDHARAAEAVGSPWGSAA